MQVGVSQQSLVQHLRAKHKGEAAGEAALLQLPPVVRLGGSGSTSSNSSNVSPGGSRTPSIHDGGGGSSRMGGGATMGAIRGSSSTASTTESSVTRLAEGAGSEWACSTSTDGTELSLNGGLLGYSVSTGSRGGSRDGACTAATAAAVPDASFETSARGTEALLSRDSSGAFAGPADADVAGACGSASTADSSCKLGGLGIGVGVRDGLAMSSSAPPAAARALGGGVTLQPSGSAVAPIVGKAAAAHGAKHAGRLTFEAGVTAATAADATTTAVAAGGFDAIWKKVAGL